MWLSDFFFLIKLMKILSSPVLNQIHERIFSAIMIEFLLCLSLKIYLNNDVWYKKKMRQFWISISITKITMKFVKAGMA